VRYEVVVGGYRIGMAVMGRDNGAWRVRDDCREIIRHQIECRKLDERVAALQRVGQNAWCCVGQRQRERRVRRDGQEEREGLRPERQRANQAINGYACTSHATDTA
jgi:hypothetical protein